MVKMKEFSCRGEHGPPTANACLRLCLQATAVSLCLGPLITYSDDLFDAFNFLVLQPANLCVELMCQLPT